MSCSIQFHSATAQRHHALTQRYIFGSQFGQVSSHISLILVISEYILLHEPIIYPLIPDFSEFVVHLHFVVSHILELTEHFEKVLNVFWSMGLINGYSDELIVDIPHIDLII